MWRSLKRSERNERTRGGRTLELAFPKRLFIFRACIPPLFLLTTSFLNVSYSSCRALPHPWAAKTKTWPLRFAQSFRGGWRQRKRDLTRSSRLRLNTKRGSGGQTRAKWRKSSLLLEGERETERGRKSEINIQGWVGVCRSVWASDTGRSRKMIFGLVSDTWKWLFTNIPYTEVWLTGFIHLNEEWHPTRLIAKELLEKKQLGHL